MKTSFIIDGQPVDALNGAVIAEFTDLRWITVEGPQPYPF
jgi:hypothetical protein